VTLATWSWRWVRLSQCSHSPDKHGRHPNGIKTVFYVVRAQPSTPYWAHEDELSPLRYPNLDRHRALMPT
jgi:hypothetical protein